jgi:hypothetical protein
MPDHQYFVFTFPDESARNETSRALRQAGFRCFGTGTAASENGFVLTLDEEAIAGRQASAVAMLHEVCPSAERCG